MGQYDPGSTADKELLAHELTHVIPQSDQKKEVPAIQRQEQQSSSTSIAQATPSGTGSFTPGSEQNLDDRIASFKLFVKTVADIDY